MGRKVAVGMSGGVDSAVAAYLLIEAGWEVVGVTSLNFPESRCCDSRSIMEAKRAAQALGIAHHVIDVLTVFQRRVIDPFVAGYQSGLTPNPCTTCNATVRFEELFEEAQHRFDVEALATGHYARVEHDPVRDRWQLRRGADPAKDQSYMLARLSQEQLARSRFPLGGLQKTETRAIAARQGLEVAAKPDSQDVCFVQGDPRGFLERALGASQRPGPIVDLKGRVLGTHAGLAYYTVGQRRGLGISHPRPLYVIGLDAPRNALVVAEHDAALGQTLRATDLNWIGDAPHTEPFEAQVQIRYRGGVLSATVTPTASGPELALGESAFAITPGQVLAVYDGDRLIASGLIAPS